jgi:hypothetical protein
MKESTTYQAILKNRRTEGQAQGAIAEARKMLLLRGVVSLSVYLRRLIAALSWTPPSRRTASSWPAATHRIASVPCLGPIRDMARLLFGQLKTYRIFFVA